MNVQEIVVLSAIFPMRFQLAVPTKLQKKIYLVVDNIIVASFPDSFPDQLYKEALIQVRKRCYHKAIASKKLTSNVQALEDGYKSSEDNWLYDDFMDFMQLSDDYLSKKATKEA